MQLALTKLLTLASNAIREQLLELCVPNEATALLQTTEEEQPHLLYLTHPRANPDKLVLIQNAQTVQRELEGLHGLELQEAAFGDMDFRNILVGLQPSVPEFIPPSRVVSILDNQVCPVIRSYFEG